MLNIVGLMYGSWLTSLGFSKTYPTIVFRPKQIRYVADHLADGTPEDPSLNDENPVWVESKDVKARVMNDVSHNKN